MVKKAKDAKKNTIITICIAAIVVIAIIIVAILAFKQGPNQLGGSDAFFTSDNTKYVIPISNERMSIDEEEPEPVKSYLVYFYNDEKITDFKTYQEYANEGIAQTAYNYFQDTIANLFKEVKLDGRFVVFTHEESDYEGITPKDVQMQIEYMKENEQNEASQDGGSDETEAPTETEAEDSEELAE